MLMLPPGFDADLIIFPLRQCDGLECRVKTDSVLVVVFWEMNTISFANVLTSRDISRTVTTTLV